MAQFKVIDDYEFPFKVGTLRTREQALTFSDYLNSKGIKAKAQPGFGAVYEVYVANESDLSNAKLELLRFGNNPFAKAYNKAAWHQGRTPKKEKFTRSRMSGGGVGGSFGFSMGTYRWTIVSLTSILEITCILIFVLMQFAGFENLFVGALAWFSISEITQDFEVYRVITPILLHFGILHIAFNMVMFEAFARQIERYLGLVKLAYIIVLVALVSNALQIMFSGPNNVFGGMSGVVYGLIGYMAMLSRRSDLPSELRLPQGLLLVSAIFIGLGFFLEGIANLCHLGGLLVGIALGLVDASAKNLKTKM